MIFNSPSPHRIRNRCRNIRPVPIGYDFVLILGADSPCSDERRAGNLGLTAGASPSLTLLMSAFALLIPPAALSSHLRRLTERSPTTLTLRFSSLSVVDDGAADIDEPDKDKPLPAYLDRCSILEVDLHFAAHRCSTAMHLECERTEVKTSTSAASVTDLAPLHLPRRKTRSVSYYAFFKGWLLLSQVRVS